MAIRRFGIPGLLPENIELVSGPGCPVCVSDNSFIDRVIALSRIPGVVIASFGDLIRVPGSTSSLEKERARTAHLLIVNSILEAIDFAQNNTDKTVVFPAIGFETTAPGTAIGLKYAKSMDLNNFYVLSSHKIMPPPMEALVKDGVEIHGYLAPGHVSAITGADIFSFLPEKYELGCVVSGFEPTDILQSILMLIKQIKNNEPKLEIQYKRIVSSSGNSKAKKAMEDVFELRDEAWRGIGTIPDSGLALNDSFQDFDAENIVVDVEPLVEPKGCICGEILKGRKSPVDCKLFGKKCVPLNPVGACMVSSEGACAAFYKYGAQN